MGVECAGRYIGRHRAGDWRLEREFVGKEDNSSNNGAPAKTTKSIPFIINLILSILFLFYLFFQSF
jgi:hypothetical protein